MAKYILGIDQGTTGSTALIFDAESMQVVASVNEPFEQHYPQPGWVEHDGEQIWKSVQVATKKVFEKIKTQKKDFNPEQIKCIGITNQRETVVPVERSSGKLLAKAIVWQCRRSTEICRQLKEKGLEQKIHQKTGLKLDPYFSASKIRWFLDHHPEIAIKEKAGDVVFLTMDGFILHRLIGQGFYTEPSNASRTMLYNIESASYDPELIRDFGLTSEKSLAEIKDSAHGFGTTKGLDFLPDGIPISGILGDQQAALMGQGCFEEGSAKCTYGTGAFLLMNIGDKVRYSSGGLLTTVAWSLKGKLTYAFEGSSFIAGAAMQFLRDQMGFIDSVSDSDLRAKDVVGAPEIYFVPALVGLGAPHWQPNARGAFLGLTRGTSQDQMIRAGLEANVFQVDELASLMEEEGCDLHHIQVDGGAANNDLLLQIQANISQKKVVRPKFIETTAIGAAFAAGLGIGLFESLESLSSKILVDHEFGPEEDVKLVEKKKIGWQCAVEAVKKFSEFQV